MYRYIILISLFGLVTYADMQKAIYDAAEEMIRFDEKMNRAIAEHNQVDIEDELQNEIPIEDFEEIENGYILKQQIPNKDNVSVELKVKEGMLCITTSTKKSESLYRIIEDSNIMGFETIMNSSSISLSIPNDADESMMKKSYINGLLEIKFPKKQKYLK